MATTANLPGPKSALACALAVAAGLVGCVPPPAPVASLPEPWDAEPPRVEPAPAAHEPVGVYHVVTPGQTLWRIARAYGVRLDELAAANGIADVTAVEVGTTLFVPGARSPLDVPPYPAPLPRRSPPSGETPSFAEGILLWPVAGGAVLSPYGAPRRSRKHAGIDIRGERGQEILAAESGRVAFSGAKRGYGKVVVLEHGEGVETLYAHAESLLVAEGESVARGQPIARVGRTGNATTEHLHFEVRVAGSAVDPLPFLSGALEARR